MVDFTVQDHGSIFVLIPNTEIAKDWIDENISDEAQYFGNGLVVEHHYIEDIVQGIINDDLTVR